MVLMSLVFILSVGKSLPLEFFLNVCHLQLTTELLQ